MSKSERDQLREIWRQLSRRSGWALVTNEDAFLNQAVSELAVLDQAADSDDGRILSRSRTAIQRPYSTLLYHGLQTRDQQAVEELWLAMLPVSLAKGWDRADAEELAQETIARVLEKFAQVPSPQTFLAWLMMIFRIVQRDYAKRRATERFVAHDVDGEARKVVGPSEMTAEIEETVLSETIKAHLRAALPNTLERIVLLRIVLFGDHPRDVARDLGLPLVSIRIAKSRALQRVRSDAAFLRLVHSVTDMTAESFTDDSVQI